MNHSRLYSTVLFGPIGDALMTVALFDDILMLEPDARFLVLVRTNAGLVREIMQAYSCVSVQEIPNGLRSIPFFASIVVRRSTFLALGVAGVYSLRLKCFFLLLSIRPGNRTIGFNDRESGQKSRLPIQQVFLFDPTQRTIDNFRRLLVPLFGEAVFERIRGKPPRVMLDTQRPLEWTLTSKKYIVIHFFGSRTIRRLPPRRMKHLLRELWRLYPYYALVLTGSESDRRIAEDIASAIPNPTLCIGLPLLQVAWIIEHSALYFGVDTGITHLAGVLQHKSIILSHSADPMWMPLYNLNARVLLNSTRCVCWTTGDCTIEEDGVTYRRCLFDISDACILDSVALALSSEAPNVPLFAGMVDEKSRET